MPWLFFQVLRDLHSSTQFLKLPPNFRESPFPVSHHWSMWHQDLPLDMSTSKVMRLSLRCQALVLSPLASPGAALMTQSFAEITRRFSSNCALSTKMGVVGHRRRIAEVICPTQGDYTCLWQSDFAAPGALWIMDQVVSGLAHISFW